MWKQYAVFGVAIAAATSVLYLVTVQKEPPPKVEGWPIQIPEVGPDHRGYSIHMENSKEQP